MIVTGTAKTGTVRVLAPKTVRKGNRLGVVVRFTSRVKGVRLTLEGRPVGRRGTYRVLARTTVSSGNHRHPGARIITSAATICSFPGSVTAPTSP